MRKKLCECKINENIFFPIDGIDKPNNPEIPDLELHFWPFITGISPEKEKTSKLNAEYRNKLLAEINRLHIECKIAKKDRDILYKMQGSEITIAIDLTPLLPGGANGGHKRYVMEMIPWIRKRFLGKLRFIFLTSSISHSEVRERLAAQNDQIICINNDGCTDPMIFYGRGDRDFIWNSSPLDMLWQLQVDLLYAPFGATGCHCPGIPTIATVVDLLHFDYPESINRGEAKYREQYFETMVKQADVFQCISDYGSKKFSSAYQIATDKIVKTYLPIVSTRRRTIHSDNKYFFYPANFWAHKNHITLLVAYANYVSIQKEKVWDLVLTGFNSPPEVCEILSYVDSLGLKDYVRYAGYVDEDELKRIWSSAAALVFPSIHEGFGIPLVEAMALGLPIICGKNTCLQEVAGEAALYVNSKNPLSIADALIELSSNEELYETLSSHAKARFEKFSFDHEMETFALAIEKSLESGPIQSTTVGFKKDGQLNRTAAFNVLQKGPLLLEGKWKAENGDGKLRIRCGKRQAGSWFLKKGEITTILAKIYSDGAPIVLEFTEKSTQAPRFPIHNRGSISCASLKVQGENGIEEIYKNEI